MKFAMGVKAQKFEEIFNSQFHVTLYTQHVFNKLVRVNIYIQLIQASPSFQTKIYTPPENNHRIWKIPLVYPVQKMVYSQMGCYLALVKSSMRQLVFEGPHLKDKLTPMNETIRIMHIYFTKAFLVLLRLFSSPTMAGEKRFSITCKM